MTKNLYYYYCCTAAVAGHTHNSEARGNLRKYMNASGMKIRLVEPPIEAPMKAFTEASSDSLRKFPQARVDNAFPYVKNTGIRQATRSTMEVWIAHFRYCVSEKTGFLDPQIVGMSILISKKRVL